MTAVLNYFSDKISGEDSRVIEPIFQRFSTARNGYYGILHYYSKLGTKEGVKVPEEEWDHIIVLDACRFDTFQKKIVETSISGELEKYRSLAPHTRGWLEANFGDRDYSDIVCTSANAWFSPLKIEERMDEVPFHYLDDVWDYGWDDHLGTVPPQEVTEAAIDTVKTYPDKRSLTFYLQPHHPFIGDCDIHWPGKNFEGKHGWQKHVWDALESGDISTDQAKRAYEQNLELVLDEVENLLDHLDGKVVITADHGNCFGELFIYGHPTAYIDPLLEVPWMEVDS